LAALVPPEVGLALFGIGVVIGWIVGASFTLYVYIKYSGEK